MTPARILVVDDEPDLEPLILQKFRRKIRAGEMEFLFARHGEDALEKLRNDSTIGVVLSDINMPVMDGLTLLTRLGELDRELKTVVVSAYDDMRNIRTAMNRGAFDFLTKPIDFKDFEVTLQKTLDELETTRESLRQREQLLSLQNEISIASRIQQSILPREFPISDRFEVHARMLPAKVVSGDFYDFFFLDEHRLAFAVGDVSGKGVPAALYMAVSRTLLRATAAQKLSPLDCLLYINKVLLHQSQGEMFVTLFYAVLHIETGELEYCVAGQPPPWLISTSGVVEPLHDVRGMMLGVFDEPEIGQNRLCLTPGMSLVIATDGLTDAANESDNPFGELGPRKVLQKSGFATASETVQNVFDAVTHFSTGAPQTDDITVLAVRFLGN